MDYLSKTNQVSRLRSSSTGAPCTTIRFFFDYSSQNNIRNNFEGLLRSFLVQIIADQPALEAQFRPYQTKSYLRDKVPSWVITKLEEAFHCALSRSSKSLTILVDGLDEYSGDVIQLIRFFHNIAESRDPEVRHKVCLASPPEKELALGFVDYPRFRIQGHNSPGIEKYVSNTMQLFKIDEQEQLSRNVANRAEVVFLWARFAVMEIVQYQSLGEEFEELLCRLEQIPSDMKDIYDRILGRMVRAIN